MSTVIAAFVYQKTDSLTYDAGDADSVRVRVGAASEIHPVENIVDHQCYLSFSGTVPCTAANHHRDALAGESEPRVG